MNLAVFPADPSEALEDSLELIAANVTRPKALDPTDPSLQDADLVIVELRDQPMRRLREAARVDEDLGIPVVIIVEPGDLALLDSDARFADFHVSPIDPAELRIRLLRISRSNREDEVITFKDLVLNTLTYQAELGGEPMDLTYMEYELLRFLVDNPTRVWSREQLLSRVWGYEYYGGARTVDVHIRRLRAKLGEERSSWIATVRSVGYRFG